jgi:hypothetical protein
MEPELKGNDVDVTKIFSEIQQMFVEEQKNKEAIRTAVHDLEQTCRVLLTHFSKIHQVRQTQSNMKLRSYVIYSFVVMLVKELCLQSDSLFEESKSKLAHLQTVIPPNSYFKYTCTNNSILLFTEVQV